MGIDRRGGLNLKIKIEQGKRDWALILANLANFIRMPIGFRGSLDLKKTIGFEFRGSSTLRDCVRV